MKRCGAVSPACLRYEVTLAILSPRCIQQCLCITRVVGDAMSPFTIPLLGPLAWIDVVLLVWFALTLLSVGYVAWDAFTNNPEMVVMKWGWVLVTLYLGPVSLFLYVMSCKEPGPGIHEEFVKPLWKQGLGSTIHCVAGDATGIIVAAVITAALGLPMT